MVDVLLQPGSLAIGRWLVALLALRGFAADGAVTVLGLRAQPAREDGPFGIDCMKLAATFHKLTLPLRPFGAALTRRALERPALLEVHSLNKIMFK